ncbi:hypothetical protein FRC10_006912 [Ceratobasidium sp. 414]|nr:hypothetical protein FRC10_006912 [Ceratobasidium sp. 414]
MVAYNRYTAVNSGQLGRRVTSGPSVLTKMEAQTLKGDYAGYDTVLPPYTPRAEAANEAPGREREQSTRISAQHFPRCHKHAGEKAQQAPASMASLKHSPEIYYETAPTMQCGGLYGTRKAHSCPPPLGLGLGPNVDFKHGQAPGMPTEENLLIRGRPPIADRSPSQASYFTVVQEFANYTRAKAQVELGFVKSHCGPMALLGCGGAYDPPKYTTWPFTSGCNFVGVEVNGFLFQDRRGSAPNYFGYRWL